MPLKFKPNRANPLDVRISHLENVLVDVIGKLQRQTTMTSRFAVTQNITAEEEGSSSGGGGGGGGGPIPESQVIFDPDDGHVHDGEDGGTPIALLGDVTGTNLASVVERIRERTIPVPGVGEDGLFVRYNNATGQFEFAAPSLGSGVCLLGAWTWDDISTLTGTAEEIPNSFASQEAPTPALVPSPMPFAGALSAIVIRLTGDVGGVGDNFTGTVTLNGTPTLLTATVTGGAAAEDSAIGTADPVIAFVAGDEITVEGRIAGAVGSERAVCTIFGFFTMEGAVMVVVMGGDISGNSDNATVDEIKGIPVPVPDAGDNQKVLVYIHGSVAWQARHPHIKPRAVNSDVILTEDDYAVDVDASVANRAITLPAIAGTDGRQYIIAKVDASANTVTIDGSGAETINGAATYVITTQYQSISLRSTGTEWRIF